MGSLDVISAGSMFAVIVVVVAGPALADDAALPSPLRVADVIRLARARRPEVAAADARARAAAERPAIVSALDDPMITPSLDHLPFSLVDADYRVTIEQRFPLSHVLARRGDAARAGAARARADVDRVSEDVELDAAVAFWQLAEVRGIAKVLDEQRALAVQMEQAANARYAASEGTQSDVLRAQVELARLDAERRAVGAEVSAAEAMLDTSLARPPDAPIPELDTAVVDGPPPAGAVATALARRPELRADRAEVARAQAELGAAHAQYAPMAVVQTGPSYMMDAGAGWTVMVGITIPLWRGKLRAGVGEAAAQVDAATADLDASRRTIAGDAVAARERVEAARARYVALRDEVVPRAQQAVASTLGAYATGQQPFVGVIEAAQTLWSVQRELIVARAELGLAWARLARATGELP